MKYTHTPFSQIVDDIILNIGKNPVWYMTYLLLLLTTSCRNKCINTIIECCEKCVLGFVIGRKMYYCALFLREKCDICTLNLEENVFFNNITQR